MHILLVLIDKLLVSWIIIEMEEFKTNFSACAWKKITVIILLQLTEVDKTLNFQSGRETKGIHAADIWWSEPVGIKNVVSCWSV